MTTYTFGDFLAEEIKKRHMSAREFGEYIGVTHTSINKFLQFGKKDVGYPSMDLILKLAKATNTDVGKLIAMIDHEVPYMPPDVSPKVQLLAEQINQLNDKQRQVIEAMIEVLQESGS
jgi:transcriptional regulator with XRE-family HTH domain